MYGMQLQEHLAATLAILHNPTQHTIHQTREEREHYSEGKRREK
jgi:hypothetical protein